MDTGEREKISWRPMTDENKQIARWGEHSGLQIMERRRRVKERVKDHLPKNTAKMETRLARLERRIKKIEENPDPSKPVANKLLYQSQAERIRQLLEAWKTENRQIAGTLIGIGTPVEAMGFMEWDGITLADRSTPEEAKMYFDFMERHGFNSNSCDRTIAMTPMVLTGQFPAPDFFITTNWECFPVYLSFLSLANLLGVPLLSIDRPPVFKDRGLIYVTRQIEEEIDYLQEIFPRHKYNQDILIERLEINRLWWEVERDIHKLRRRKPCPIAGIENFRELQPANTWKLLEYRRAYRDQLYANADKGNTPSKAWGTEEKLRLCWAVSGMFYYDPFTFLDRLGVSVPIWVWSDDAEKKSGREPVVGDQRPFGRKLKPLEEVARALKFGWGDRSDYFVNSIISTCRELDLDGIVYFKQRGCSPTMSLGGIVNERAERELGIPTLELEGRQLDQRGFNEKELLRKLVDFVNVCLGRKHLPPLTKKELEKAGYDNPSQFRVA